MRRCGATILAALAWFNIAVPVFGQTTPAKRAEPTCATFAPPVSPGMGKFEGSVELLQAGLQFHWYGERTVIDATVMTPAEEEKYLEHFCRSHPDSPISAAQKDLIAHMAALTAAKGVMAAPIPDDLEAPSDVRAFVVAHAMEMSAGRSVLNYDGPDFLPGLEYRLAKDVTGAITRVPSIWNLAFNDTGAAMPEFPTGFKVLAVVRPRLRNSDIPPGDDEDSYARSEGLPTFYIGANGHDVWEVGKVAGVVSVRRVSESSAGPWEPFEKDRAQYRLYSEHVRDGRTVEDDFTDLHAAALVLAACRGDASAIAKALREGADPNAKGAGGDTPIFWAIACNNAIGLEQLLKAGADPNYRLPGTVLPKNERDPSAPKTYTIENYSALHVALSEHKFAAVRLLLQYGAYVGASDDDRPFRTTLYLGLTDATWDSRKAEIPGWDLREALLDADKDIGRTCESQKLVEHLAMTGHYDLVEAFLKRGYRCDYVELGRSLSMRGDALDNPDLSTARGRVTAFLRKNGVTFPVPALVQIESGRASMGSDGTITVLWYGGYPKDGSSEVSARRLILKPGDADYPEMLERVGGLRPLESKGIPKRSDDPDILPHRPAHPVN